MSQTSGQPALTNQQAMRLLNVSDRETVPRLIRAGKLRGAQVGRSWRVDPDSIREFLSGGRQAISPPAEPPATPPAVKLQLVRRRYR